MSATVAGSDMMGSSNRRIVIQHCGWTAKVTVQVFPSNKRKRTAMQYCGEAAEMTAEVFPSNKRKKSVVPVCTMLLPHDMMLEVLLRLPVKSILRFRAVCRSWDALFSSGGRWRPATGRVPFRWSKFAYSAVDHAVMNKIPPVFANGFLHWLINPSLLIRRPRAAIITFSVTEETFGCVRSPPFWGPEENLRPWSESEGEHLFVMDDQVCIVRNLRDRIPDGKALEIWGLLDYGSGDWSLNHRIDLFGHVGRELGDPQVVRVIGSVGNCRSGKKIIIATSKHLVDDKFQKKLHTYDPRCQVLEGLLSVTETHTSVTRFIPGSTFSLFEESIAPVHKTDEEFALTSAPAKGN